MSKATPTSAIAKFAAGGKKTKKKDLGMMAISYNDVYVAQIAIEANPMQAIKAIQEAENYPGPSLIIGYTHVSATACVVAWVKPFKNQKTLLSLAIGNSIATIQALLLKVKTRCGSTTKKPTLVKCQPSLKTKRASLPYAA